MTIKEIHDYIVFILNKETTGYISHDDIDAAIDRGQMSKFMELYSNPKLHQPGRPIPPVAYGQTQKISDDLRFFKHRKQFTTNNNGILDLGNFSKEDGNKDKITNGNAKTTPYTVIPNKLVSKPVAVPLAATTSNIPTTGTVQLKLVIAKATPRIKEPKYAFFAAWPA